MVLEIDRICKSHGIQYFLIYGSVLGAVRHQGFIPWDDDIDIALRREEFIKFIKVCHKELSPSMFLQYWKTEPNAMVPFVRICLNNTTFTDETTKHLHVHQGIYIDVNPLDGIPESRILMLLQRKTLRFLRIIFELKCINVKSPQLRNRLLTRFVRPLIPLQQINRLYNWIASRKSSYHSKILTNMFQVINPKVEILDQAWFQKATYLSFEGHELPMPHDYDAYLKRIYGDYWVVPPPEKRRKHANFVNLGSGCHRLTPEKY